MSNHFVSSSCAGEHCSNCWLPATHKVGEEMASDDPHPLRHNLTAYLCCTCFKGVMGRCATDQAAPNLVSRAITAMQADTSADTPLWQELSRALVSVNRVAVWDALVLQAACLTGTWRLTKIQPDEAYTDEANAEYASAWMAERLRAPFCANTGPFKGVRAYVGVGARGAIKDFAEALAAEGFVLDEPLQKVMDASALSQEDVKPYTYYSTQSTRCAGCHEQKHTPLRIDSLGGYVCLTCVDKAMENPMASGLRQTSEFLHDDDMGVCLFFHFDDFVSRPRSCLASFTDSTFDPTYWSHFVTLDVAGILRTAFELD